MSQIFSGFAQQGKPSATELLRLHSTSEFSTFKLELCRASDFAWLESLPPMRGYPH
jgi:hypothetical protein